MNQGRTSALGVLADESRQPDVLNRLAETKHPREAAALVGEWAKTEVRIRSAVVAYSENAAHFETEPPTKLDPETLDFLRLAAEREQVVQSTNGRLLARRLFRTPAASAILLIEVDRAADGRHFFDDMSTSIEIAGLHLRRVLELADARASLQRFQDVQAALFSISDLSVDLSQTEFCRHVHALVGRFIAAESFYIGLLTDSSNTLEFIYFVDTTHKARPSHLGVGLNEYALKHGKALLRRAQIQELVSAGTIVLNHSELSAACWLGVPLVVDKRTIGLIVVQSYDEDVTYGPNDEELMVLVAAHVARSLHRRQTVENLHSAYAQLKQRIEERTQELHVRNAELEIAYAKLKNAQEQAVQSEKLASIGQLAAGVAHEINNPIGYVNSNLGTLQGYVSQLLDAVASYKNIIARRGDTAVVAAAAEIQRRIDIDYLATDVPQLIAESREGVDRVCKIVRDLKDFSRSDRGEAWARVDVHQLLDSTLNIASNQLKYKAEVVKTFGDLPLVECLPSELNQVFLNILVNAGQAIKAHGIITVSTGTAGDKVWIAIGDDGAGIPADVLPRIFDPFFTTKPVGTGTGLGLSISYGIVAKHHGNIEVTSVPGQGTLLRIELPIEQPKQSGA